MALPFTLLTSIFKNVFGGNLPTLDSLKEQFLADVGKQVDANGTRAGAKQLARGVLKAVGAAMHPGTKLELEKRIAVGTALAAAAADQLRQAADQLEAYAEAQAQRERTRDKEGQEEALEAREAAELEFTEDLIDVFRTARGQSPREGD